MSKRLENLATIDGNAAAMTAAYAMSDLSFIFPITPATGMSALADVWAGQEKKNIFDQPLCVQQMQSEAGVAGAVHGAAQAGSLVSTFTSCQGLLLMIPNMYKMAGEFLPVVFHVATRVLADIAMNISPDHSDIMAVRSSGFTMLCSASVQETMDFGCVAHLAAIESRLPVLHFFDGFRTSHEVHKIDSISREEVKEMYPFEALASWRMANSMCPDRPKARGGVYNSDIHWQVTEAGRPAVNAVPGIVQKWMDRIAALTGRSYHIFDYSGAPDAEYVIAMMGSAVPSCQEAVDYLVSRGEKVGVLAIRLYRPFSIEKFLDALPKTCRRLVVLDRSKEQGANGGPLYQEMSSVLFGKRRQTRVFSGYYGIAGKDFNPTHVQAVFNNIRLESPMNFFLVGINDTLTKKSLPLPPDVVDAVPEGTRQCLFYALGADGTVSANKNAISIIGDATTLDTQAYFVYDAKKSGGCTVSHLRFGKKKIKSQYEIDNADYVACHCAAYVFKYDMTTPLRVGGVFALNARWTTIEALDANLPGAFKKALFEKKARLCVIDASQIAEHVGLEGRINMIMQTVFFKLAEVLPLKQAISLLKEAVRKMFAGKGQDVVDKNINAIDRTLENLREIEIPVSWKDAEVIEVSLPGNTFMDEVGWPSLMQRGNSIPTDKVVKIIGGWVETGVTKFEKRQVTDNSPLWDPSKCIQCNRCGYACGHAVIRPFILDEDEKKSAPEGFKTKAISGRQKKLMPKGGYFSIVVSTDDCIGCRSCVVACPKDALTMVKTTDPSMVNSMRDWQYVQEKVKEKPELIDPTNMRDNQFVRPLLEFSGACGGCTETVYVRLLTQLFGEELLIADSCGCSLVWGSTYPAIPYTRSRNGRGPAQGGTLFEDTAEFGYGMAVASAVRRKKLIEDVRELVDDESVAECSGEVRALFKEWLPVAMKKVEAKALADKIHPVLPKTAPSNKLYRGVWDSRDLFARKVIWIVGGDGWAYDIGFGGLDQVLSMGFDLNILVLDTEVYSNTGGQKSKATPRSATAGFAALGQTAPKKDLGVLAIGYDNVYVASTAVGANPNQALQTIVEAEDYEGTSLIIGYCPCIAHGLMNGMGETTQEAKLAVDSGYWPLYRYDPRKPIPLKVESKKPSKPLKDFLLRENRFQALHLRNSELAEELQRELEADCAKRRDRLDLLAAAYKEKHEKKMAKEKEASGVYPVVVFGSDTGNTEGLATTIKEELAKTPGVLGVDLLTLDAYAATGKLATEERPLVLLCSTCGDGEVPGNAEAFVKALDGLSSGSLEKLKFFFLGCGDSSYDDGYNKAAKDIFERLVKLGGKPISPLVLADDSSESKSVEQTFDEFRLLVISKLVKK